MKNIIAFAFLFVLTTLAAGETAKPLLTDADEVMVKVLAHDSKREMLGEGYTGHRWYIFNNDRVHKRAELLVTVRCGADGTKHFDIVAEKGWKTANHRVFRGMLESEAQTSLPANRAKSRLVPDNYFFEMVEVASVDGRSTYVIDVTPKRRDKQLFQGRIWIDATDYALVRAEGKPARLPSFWTRSIQFVQRYQKAGEFWFPASTESVTQAFIAGKTNVSIQYFDYEPNVAPNRNTFTAEKASLRVHTDDN